MNTVRIGDKDCKVKAATLGLLKDHLLPARKRMEAATEDEMPDAIVAFVLCYLDCDPDVTAAWLLDNLPADPKEAIREIIVASGQRVKDKGTAAGEAARP